MGQQVKFFPVYRRGTVQWERHSECLGHWKYCLRITSYNVCYTKLLRRKLGAVVEVFDVRAAVKEEVKSLGGKFVEVEGAKDEAAAGGYAVEQSEEYKKKQGELIQERA